MKRVRLGPMTNPVRGLLHGTAAILAVVGLVLLSARTEESRIVPVVIFGASVVALFITSSLYHSAPWTLRWKKRMQRLDHCMILVLIAGTYTPIGAIVLPRPLGTIVLGVIWGLAALGVAQKVWLPRLRPGYGVALMTLMGWLAVLVFPDLLQLLPVEAVLLTLLGGVFYTAGMACFATERPKLIRHVFSYHELFHVLVIAGSLSHYLVIAIWVVPFRAA